MPFIDPIPMEEDKITEPAREAVKFINGLLEKMGIEGKATVLAASEEDHIRIDISGPDMGPVIGRRGDTLDAIQYLTSLVLNKFSEEHLRLTIDTENYRAKRAESLERLARKMAIKVSKYHKAMTLEPMNPYERRIIHAALQDFRGVTTYSTGTEPGKYHKAMTLEPMNPYERRIIHAALQDFRGVTTYSTGTEPGRRVVIAPEGGAARAPRRGFQPRNKK